MHPSHITAPLISDDKQFIAASPSETLRELAEFFFPADAAESSQLSDRPIVTKETKK
jgi:hypothetical protein